MTGRRRGGLDPTTALLVKLDAVSGRLASEQVAPLEAAAELREIAGGRTDLLARVAGSLLGRFLARPGACRPDLPLAVAYLVLAGADRGPALVETTDTTRAWTEAPTHTT